MQYRRFGRTELSMPVFSCGGMRYQYQWQDTEPKNIPEESQRNLEATIKMALEVGINHIETARGYGTSEMQLGKILPKIPREQYILQTKGSPQEKAQDFLANFEKSLGYLKVDYVDLFGLHGINTPQILDYCLRPGGCLDVAHQLQAQGKVRFIGFSTHASTEVILQAIASNQFDYVNLHWYYIFQKNWTAIEAAREKDMGVFIISPTNKGGLLDQPSAKLVELCQPLSPMVFNDLFCLSYPQVHTLSIGASRPTDIAEHLKTLDYLEDPEPVLKPIINRLEKAFIETLGEEWVNTWEKGLPTIEETPGNVSIRTILWLRNLAIAYDLVEYGKMRYNLLGNGGHWFPGEQAKALANFDLKDCLKKSPHCQVIPQYLQETHELLGGETVKRLSQSA